LRIAAVPEAADQPLDILMFGAFVATADSRTIAQVQPPARSSAMTEPAEILAQLEVIRAETLRRLDGLSQEQLDWLPIPPEQKRRDEDIWSAGEVFMHLAIDEHYLRENIARPLVEGVKPPDGITFVPPPPPYGAHKDVILFWLNRARLMTRRLLEAWPANASLALQHAGGLQPMNGAEWLQAYGGHEQFHHKQLDSLVAQMQEISDA
jgi:hypothetical protein